MTSKSIAAAALMCAGLVAAAAPAHAASVPAWLDEGISNWNQANPDAAIRFVSIKDSYVWYDMPKAQDIDQKLIRERLKAIVHKNGYEPMDEEDLVTTGKPPVTAGRSTPKKCWSRSFVYNIQAQNNTKSVDDERSAQRQRLLTSMICEDSSVWWAAFRVAE